MASTFLYVPASADHRTRNDDDGRRNNDKTFSENFTQFLWMSPDRIIFMSSCLPQISLLQLVVSFRQWNVFHRYSVAVEWHHQHVCAASSSRKNFCSLNKFSFFRLYCHSRLSFFFFFCFLLLQSQIARRQWIKRK